MKLGNFCGVSALRKAAVVLALAGFLTGVSLETARADIMILPIRTVFKDRDRTKTLTVVNTSDKAATFKLSFYNQRQTPDGGYAKQDEPINPKYDLSKLLVFSPRQVDLPPSGKQSVRFSLRRPANFPDGEYRVHLKLQRISNDNGPELQQANKKGASGRITINVGFSVPVIVRQGSNDAKAKIAEPKFVRGSADGKKPPRVEFFLDRTGKFSTLGRADIFWRASGGADEKKVGTLNDLNVYAETARRSVSIALNDKEIVGGTFRIVYEGDEIDKGISFDEKVFTAQ